MKHLFGKAIFIFVFAWAFTFYACQESTESKDNKKDSAEDVKEEKVAAKDTAKDNDFIVEQIKGNMGEIKLAQLAKKKSANKEIKEIATMLENDHTAVLNQLKTLAANRNLSVPTEEPEEMKDQAEKLSKEKQSEFDRDWCEALMEKHKKGIEKYEDASNNLSDPDLRNWATNTLPKLRTHHDKLMACHNKLK